MMKNFFLRSVLLSLSFVLIISSCKTTQSVAKVDDKLPLDKTLLWEITGKGIKKPSYLYGTIHIIPEKDFFLPEKTKKLISSSERLVTEVDLSNIMGQALGMMKLAPMKNGKKLSDLLGEEDFTEVKNFFQNESTSAEVKLMPFKLLETWKPMLLSSLLINDMIKGPTKSYEMELLQQAKAENIELAGLETFEYQLSVFDSVAYDEQAVVLLEMIRDIKKGNSGAKEFDSMIKLYLSQDIDALYSFTSENSENMTNFEDVLLETRNRNWIPHIVKMSKEKTNFFAVGAGHLGGPKGLIRLLRAEGLTLKPVLAD